MKYQCHFLNEGAQFIMDETTDESVYLQSQRVPWSTVVSGLSIALRL